MRFLWLSSGSYVLDPLVRASGEGGIGRDHRPLEFEIHALTTLGLSPGKPLSA
jgi:hypothetical protein